MIGKSLSKHGPNRALRVLVAAGDGVEAPRARLVHDRRRLAKIGQGGLSCRLRCGQGHA